jgi:glucose-1-phosphate thymidylyltransferase
MRAIIPVAGVGTRLRPHTFTLPKVLLTVAGKPILGHIIDKIKAEGINEATIVVGHMGDKVYDYLSKSYPEFRFDYIEQSERLGLGHAIYLSRHTLSDAPTLIILGDTIFDVNLAPVLSGTESSIGVKVVDDPRRFGVAVLRDGYIEKLVEKPEQPISRLAVVGLYYIRETSVLVRSLERLVAEDIRTKGEYQLTDALQLMLEQGVKIRTFPVEGWYDCGKPETLLETNRALLSRASAGREVPGVIVNNPVYIAPTAVLSNCVIGPFASVGDHAEISESIVRNSIISQGARVSRVLLDNSIIGNDSIVTGGFKRFNIGGSSEIETE